MEAESNILTELEPVFVARQPIFTPGMQIWGYELLFRHAENAGTAVFSDSRSATAQVILDGYAIAQEGISNKARIFINFSRRMILDDLTEALPSGMVVELLEDAEVDDELLSKCRALKKTHFLAIDDYTGQTGYERLLELADIIKVDVLNLNRDQLVDISERLRPYGARLLAEKVEDADMFHLTRELGFSLFQGFFFSRPMVVEGRKLSTRETARLRILRELSREAVDLGRLKNIIQTEVSITYRLLTYINSPGFGLLGKVRSVEHALQMLGENRIRQWFRVLVLADMNATARGQEVVHISAARAFFLKFLNDRYPGRMGGDTIFTVGLLSMLDALLDQPFDSILSQMRLSDEINDALTGQERQSSLRLDLVRHIESGKWSEIKEISENQGFSLPDVAQAYAAALNLSHSLLGPDSG